VQTPNVHATLLEEAPAAPVEPAWPPSPSPPGATQSASLSHAQVVPMHAKPAVHAF
jgi:hypothetical protein